MHEAKEVKKVWRNFFGVAEGKGFKKTLITDILMGQPISVRWGILTGQLVCNKRDNDKFGKNDGNMQQKLINVWISEV